MGLISSLLKAFKNDNTNNYQQNTQSQNQYNDYDRIQKLRAIEEEMFEKTRNLEVEDHVKKSLSAVECNLVDFDTKAKNIAGWITCKQSLTKSSMRNAFSQGARVGAQDFSLKNSFKLPKAADYYYENFYSEQKQLEIYNKCKEIENYYNQLMENVNNHYNY